MKIEVDNRKFEPQRIFCIGRNYVAHIEELQNERPTAPVIFLKPATSLVSAGEPIRFPSHGSDLHHEVEVVLLIGKDGAATNREEAVQFLAGITIGLDLTLRDVQSRLKAKGLPWEKAKAFEQSAPIGNFRSFTQETDLTNISFGCRVNGELRQQGNTANMIFDIPALILEISKIWQLRAGDLVYTGTPEGVGPLKPGDQIEIFSEKLGQYSWTIRETGY